MKQHLLCVLGVLAGSLEGVLGLLGVGDLLDRGLELADEVAAAVLAVVVEALDQDRPVLVAVAQRSQLPQLIGTMRRPNAAKRRKEQDRKAEVHRLRSWQQATNYAAQAANSQPAGTPLYLDGEGLPARVQRGHDGLGLVRQHPAVVLAHAVELQVRVRLACNGTRTHGTHASQRVRPTARE